MPGTKHIPPPSGNLPARGKRILKNVYEDLRIRHPEYTKERCAREAWTVVDRSGFVKNRKGIWIDTKTTKFKRMYASEKREHPEFSRSNVMKIVEDHYK